MGNEDLVERLREQFGDDEEILNQIVMFENPSYTDAVIGISHDNRLIYSYAKMVEYLMETDSMSEIDAMEFIEYNTIGALPCVSNPPIVMYDIIDL